ncbi:MAG: cytochrome b N-terminal domain-containing protein [Bacillota bacterium]|nr:cytochrome b N-terminal domain-containing protein [Bacillota bacterium]
MKEERGRGFRNWLDQRLGYRAAWAAVFERSIPEGLNWAYTLGSATLFVFILQALTGIFLALYYTPNPDNAWQSIQFIENHVAFGPMIRSLHHWGASAMVVLVFLHMLRVYFMGSFKYPRELTWIVGVILLFLVLAMGFTGYLLPWDEKAYWATTVGTNMVGAVPFVGSFLEGLLRGGPSVGVLTLPRFYAVHMLFLPALLVLFITLHLVLVIRLGISTPPKAARQERLMYENRAPVGRSAAAQRGVRG